VCANGVDLDRYPYPLPRRETVTIGWAGGTGHERALRPWLPAVAAVLEARPQARFRSVGQPFGHRLAERFGDRASAVPFTALDTYPAAMAAFDVALAPAAPSAFFTAKSDLRFLEAAALGVPVVADPAVYSAVVHGETGLHAATADAAREHLLTLIDDAGLRHRLGTAARAYVERERSSAAAARAWADALKNTAPRPIARV
jgi:glycosyltransferase involved in cell wall biosynthesis